MSIPYCLTNTLDTVSPSGYRYYHNIQQDNRRIKMRPRLPIRFDVNDAEFLPMAQDQKKAFLSYYNRNRTIQDKRLFQWRRTGFSQFNTFLMYSLSVVLIVASVGHMKRLVQATQEDRSLTHKDRVLFRITFVLSFVLSVFLLCVIALSVFELCHNSDIIPSFTRNNIQYKNLSWIKDGRMFHLRTIILVFVGCGMLLALAETINLFIMKRNRPTLLLMFVPIFFCIILLSYLFMF